MPIMAPTAAAPITAKIVLLVEFIVYALIVYYTWRLLLKNCSLKQVFGPADHFPREKGIIFSSLKFVAILRVFQISNNFT
jgi:hypothetical protein